MKLEGKVAVVTGAHRGIGKSTVELLASEGAHVVGVDIIPGEPHPGSVRIEADVREPGGWEAVARLVADRFGRLDALANIAGVGGDDHGVHDCDLADWDDVLRVNTTGTMLGMRFGIPAMEASGGGSIVNIASVWASDTVPGWSAYHASKGAVVSLSRNAAITYGGKGIRVNSVHPGYIDTAMSEGMDWDAISSETPLARPGLPLDVAKAVLFLLSDQAEFITGTELIVDGGFSAGTYGSS